MDVSIIIPTNKRPQKLQKLLESLSTQKTKEKFEIIVVDNGDDEKTKILCDLFKVKYLKTEGNIGPGKARDLGVKIAKSEVLAFVDDDEYVADNWVETIAENIKNKKVIYGTIKTDIKPYYPFIHSFDRGEGIMPSGNFAIKRFIYDKVNGFEGANSFFGEDWFIWDKLKKLNIKPKFVEDMIVYHPAVFKNWLSKNLIAHTFKQYYYSFFLRKKIKDYPLEEFFNGIIKKILISLVLLLILILISDKIGILIYYFINLIYFSYKSYIVSKNLSKNSMKFPKSQLIFYSFCGLFNQFIQLLSFSAAFYYFVFFKCAFYKEEKNYN